MDKTFYMTPNVMYEGISYMKISIFGFLIYENRTNPFQYLIEVNEENKEWFLIEVLKGNIDPSTKIIFDADKLKGGWLIYDIKNKKYIK